MLTGICMELRDNDVGVFYMIRSDELGGCVVLTEDEAHEVFGTLGGSFEKKDGDE